MSIVMRLDRQAVAKLVEDDPEFKYDLQRNVVAEVIRRFVDKDALKIITAANPDLMKEALDAIALTDQFRDRVTKALNDRIAVKPPGYAYTFKLTPEFQKLVDEEVARQIAVAIVPTVNTRVEEALAGINERIDRQVEYAVSTQTAKMVNDKVAQRMAAITVAAAGA